MHVEDIMTRQVTSCEPGDTLDRAATLMWDSDCGLLPVCAKDGTDYLIGVITDRDVCMSALFQGKPLHEIQVSEAMASQVQICHRGDTLADAEVLMRKARLRRLPVVDEDGSLAGILTLADLAREASRERSAGTRNITEAEIGDTLAMICDPGQVPGNFPK